MNRNEAIELVGLALVEAVEKENCQMTGRLTDDSTIEFIASVLLPGDREDLATRLNVYYYQEHNAEFKACDDLSNLNWHIERYEVR